MDKRFRILAVDDEPVNIQLIKAALKEDYDFLMAINGHDAVDQLEQYKPDLILLDVLMPELNGFEVCSVIKADERFADIPVIFMTALDTHEGALQGLELGAVDYLTKPVNIALLKLRVRNHIALKEQRDQLSQQKEELVQLLAEQEALHARERDAEEQKLLLQQQLQQSQKLESLGVLAGGIAHDFNNILTVIIGTCYLVKLNPEAAVKHIETIERAADRAAGLCRQMLAYAGKATLEMTQVDMKALLEDTVKMLKATIQPDAIITLNLAEDVPAIRGDASQIRQIVMNLLTNAVEATGEAQGIIHVSLEKKVIAAGGAEEDCFGTDITPGSYLLLEVADSGCGMDDDTRRRLFEPFFTTKFTGRGLGLSATLGIITAHGGALQLSSQPGQGARFKVYLPAQINSNHLRPVQ